MTQTHILNVSDDEANRYVTTRTLRVAGFRVTEASTGAEALALAQEKPDLLILDVRLPDMTGFEVCRRIKSSPKTANIIVVHTSATFVSSEKRVEGLDSGADGYLVQPMEPPELVATVRALLRARRAEEQALSAARQWQSTFDAISDGVCLLDERGFIAQTNRAFEELVGRSAYQVRSRSHREVLRDLLGNVDAVPVEESRKTRARATTELATTNRWFRVTVDPIIDEHQTLTNFVCIVTDITERKRTYEALRLSEARFRRVVNSNVIGLFFSTIDGQITDANDTFLELTGYDREDLLAGRITVRAITPDDHLARTLHARDELLHRSYYSAFEREHLRKDGTRVPVLVAGAFIDDSHDQVVTFVLDITQRKQLEAELRSRVVLLAESDRRKDEFLAMLAHELRNPLSAILTSLYLQDRVGAQDERNVKLRATVTRQAKHLARMVDDLLEVSRITRGKIQLKKERIDLTAAVRQAINSTRAIIEGRRHELTVSVSDDELWLQADPTRIEQIITNLISNAAKYTDPGGRIEVALTNEFDRDGSWAVLSVRDNGIGVPPEMLPEIFDLFVQVDQSLARSQGGLGIGLTMVQNLVRLHGGTVRAFSGGVGKGSEFVVRLPLVAVGQHTDEAPPSLITSHRKGESRGLDILVIEDNADARETIAYLLDLHGHRVRVAYDGFKGLELMEERLPDVALVDIGMDGLNGYEVAERIRKLTGGQQVFLVAMTGYGRPEDRERSAAAGFDLHLVKPVEARELLALLDERLPTRPPDAPTPSTDAA